MRVRNSDIEIKTKPKKKQSPSQGTAKILAAIKNIKLEPVEPVIIEQKIPDEILEQQRAMMEKMSEVPVPPDFPSYHFEVNRSSDGFIKSVDATPTNTDIIDDRSVAENWYK